MKFPRRAMNRVFLTATLLMSCGSVTTVSHAQSRTMAPAQVEQGSLLAQGSGPLSKWVVLVGRYDSSPAVVCNDATVSLNGRLSSHSELADMVRVLGVHVSGPGPWRYNCNSGATGNSAARVQYEGGSYDASGAVASEPPASVEPRQVSIYESFAEDGDSVVDRLAARGFEPMGCIEGANGAVKVAMKSNLRTIMVTLTEVKRSKIAPLVKCRL